MAKSDYCIDMGMWSVNPPGPGSGDTLLNSVVPEFRLIWDGHNTPSVRACNVLSTDGGGIGWGYAQQERDPQGEAYAFGEWILRLKEANEAGADIPRYLKSIVFRQFWGLVWNRGWEPAEVQQMVKTFLDYFFRHGDPQPSHLINGQTVFLTPADLNLVRGYLLGDDFTAHSYDARWDEIVRRVCCSQRAYLLNLPFYFTNDVGALLDNTKPFGQRLENLKPWLNVFRDMGAIPVFVPQYYPWANQEWVKHDDRDPYIWWDIFLDELLNLKNTYCCQLRVQPILQACALDVNIGPGHVDLHNQLRAVLNHPVVNGVWLLAWRPTDTPNHPYYWACYRGDGGWQDTEDHWTDREHIGEVVQVEAGGAVEVITTPPNQSHIIGANPGSFTPGPTYGTEGTLISFELASRQDIQIYLQQFGGGPGDERRLLNPLTWTQDSNQSQHAADFSWMFGVYDRNPDPNEVQTRDPLHGTAVNWDGYKDNIPSQRVVAETYGIQLQNGNGDPLDPMTTTVEVN